ncbi:molybdopterin-guanine dinucleotide biosynthesis protein B [Thermosediminibacter litoriperuensis]|uniref:Molybdopterin-guanine dinucleotide biosynthesis protein B n=1 Tax=Thermosediminibacter litoriperuensis TaxID=291989 RepID=A0A5S5AXF5_9FIRM|nr:molybdopterin-guanine dinucleotide biosynthesis protein B [Thermosediminibacter litoriperuensis]TYP56762.1 molybdopterin-guanine dinucleotide biosynthesis protein B [Thermosediminibacter litoriperuensis]
MKVTGFVGFSDSGKTTLITWVVRELKKRGIKVGVVKHTPHGFDVGQKDTGRFFDAGADAVIASSGKELLKIERCDGEKSLFEILDELKDMDVVLVEGYKGAGIPRVVVFGKRISRDDIELLNHNKVLALVIEDTSMLVFIKKHFYGGVVEEDERGNIRIRLKGCGEIPVIGFYDDRLLEILMRGGSGDKWDLSCDPRDKMPKISYN